MTDPDKPPGMFQTPLELVGHVLLWCLLTGLVVAVLSLPYLALRWLT